MSLADRLARLPCPPGLLASRLAGAVRRRLYHRTARRLHPLSPWCSEKSLPRRQAAASTSRVGSAARRQALWQAHDCGWRI